MSSLKDKQFNQLKSELENVTSGAEKHQKTKDKNHPLPTNFNKKRYDSILQPVVVARKKAIDAERAVNEAYAAYHETFSTANNLIATDMRVLKGIYGVHSETLRDFGIQPEKQRPGRQTKTVAASKP